MDLDQHDQPTLRKLVRIAMLDLRIHRDVIAQRGVPVEPTRTADLLTLDRERELQARVDWLDRMLDAAHPLPLL